jgi:pimeloyl-ACP methyl ester carboxylesterase
MPFVTTQDGTSLFVRRWGDGPPIVFCHGWAMNSDSWQPLMLSTSRAGFQAIAYDRRGHGRSDDPGRGYDYDTLADDLDAVLKAMDVTGATLVGHSMGAGEIVRYLGRHGAGRVERVVMIAPSLPYNLKTQANPEGSSDAETVKAWRELWVTNYADWIAAAVAAAYGPNAPPERVRETTRMMLQCSVQAAIALNVLVTETDFRPELRRIATPTLVLHGDADGSCPLEATGARLPPLKPNCRLKVYPGANHALVLNDVRDLAADITSFIGEAARTQAAA